MPNKCKDRLRMNLLDLLNDAHRSYVMEYRDLVTALCGSFHHPHIPVSRLHAVLNEEVDKKCIRRIECDGKVFFKLNNSVV